MAATATAPRYAPDDPTLPKPWRGLVDGKTGYLYFWNPETDVTQYERPSASGFASRTKSSFVPLSSSVHARDYSPDEEDKHRRGGNGGSKLASGARSQQISRGGTQFPQNVPNGTLSGGHGVFSTRGHGGSSGGGSGLSGEDYRRRHEITVSGDDVPPPLTTFETTGFPSEILREVHGAGFSAPTPIQAQSWPIALQSRDIVAVAKTGSGKTLGYLIPGFIHFKRCHNNSQMGPTILVLSPTRELATQIQVEAVKFGKSSRISCTCLYGGAPKGPQLRDLDRGADIVVATPGRLNDILEMRRVSLRQVSYLVLDEADRMLDMGFEPQIRKIVKEVPARRQTLMFTATWPKEVRKIAADLLVNPVQVNIGSVDELVANKSITQYVEVLSMMEKHRRLEQILRSQEPGSKILIFCSTKKMCDQLSRNLTRQFGAAAIHGDKSQGERDYVLNQFRTGKSPILVATDVAARGLDIKDIRAVINYDFPTGIEDYVHRIGRTGRAGATGIAFTFFGDQDAKHASDLIKVLEGANQRVPPQIRDMALRSGGLSKTRRWGSGSSGRDSNYGGRGSSQYGGRGGSDYGGRGVSDHGGRGGWSERRGDRGSGYDSRDRDRHDRGYNDSSDGKYGRSYHASGIHSGDKDKVRGRSRSRSPNKGFGYGDVRRKSRSRSRSLDRYVKRSFHESKIDRFGSSEAPQQQQHFSTHSAGELKNAANPQSPPHEKSHPPSNAGGGRGSFGWGASPGRQDNGRYVDGSGCGSGEDEEEGMIPTEHGA